MKGVVYFGQHSLGIESWVDQVTILNTVTNLADLICKINVSSYAKVCAPNDWSAYEFDGKDFWGCLAEAVNHDDQMLSLVATKIYSEMMRGSLEKGVTFSEAIERLENNNPNHEALEYYSALKTNVNWPNINGDLHVSSLEELFDVALEVLKNAPVNEENYATRCDKIFQNLIFHPDFMQTLTEHGTANRKTEYGNAPTRGICGFSNSVTDSLKALDAIDLVGKTPQDVMKEVKEKSGYDCTAQGKNKENLKFFYGTGGGGGRVNCEYHIKIHENNVCDNVFYQDRIYFGFLDIQGQKKIFVAHSGKHL